jgi:hypothetical protein
LSHSVGWRGSRKKIPTGNLSYKMEGKKIK